MRSAIAEAGQDRITRKTEKGLERGEPVRIPEERKVYLREYRLLNREKTLAYQAEYRSANREKIRLTAAEHRANSKNRERVLLADAEYRAANKEKVLAANAKYRAKPGNRKRLRDMERKRRYGVTPEQVAQMTISQNHACAICFRIRKLGVDHNHTTGKVRELLCLPCNMAIGLLQESLTVLESAKSYLQKHATP